MSDNPKQNGTEAEAEAPKRVLRDLDVLEKEADQVKAGARRRDDPCSGGE